ncbi:MAG: hypothetical protein ACJAYU_001813 [Bradymonadia bacterium]|jgi:hypothetical protein
MIPALLLYFLALTLLASTYAAARGGLRSDDANALLSMEPEDRLVLSSRSGLTPPKGLT